MMPPPPGYVPVAYAPLWPSPPRVWTVFVAFLVAIAAGLGGSGVFAFALAFAVRGPEVLRDQSLLEDALLVPAILLPTMLLTQVIIGGVALGAAFFSPVPMRRRLRLARPRSPWYGYAVVVIGTLALAQLSSYVIELLGFGDTGVLEEFERAISGMRGAMLVAATAVIGLAPGFGEELLFRGYIHTRLRQRWPRLLAAAVSALLFGIIHLDLVQGTFAVALGLWLAEVADRTGSIWPCVVAHAINNSFATLAAALVPGGVEPQSLWWGLVITAAVFGLCLLYVLRRPVVPPEREESPSRATPDPV
jgi:membrane protease YdiL (CAAX protease family)